MTVNELIKCLKLYAGNRPVVVRTDNMNHIREVKGTTVIGLTLMVELRLEEDKHPAPFLG